MNKTEINCRVQARYDELMNEGKHGHYETMFKVVHEEIAATVEACAAVCDQEANSWRSPKYNYAAASAMHCAKNIRAMRKEKTE